MPEIQVKTIIFAKGFMGLLCDHTKGKNGSGFTPKKMATFLGWNGLDGP